MSVAAIVYGAITLIYLPYVYKPLLITQIQEIIYELNHRKFLLINLPQSDCFSTIMSQFHGEMMLLRQRL